VDQKTIMENIFEEACEMVREDGFSSSLVSATYPTFIADDSMAIFCGSHPSTPNWSLLSTSTQVVPSHVT
jgi:hypothetical protein